jgi:putative ABC transport system substrate-binding protein
VKRREFITLLGGAAAFTPFAARAQQAMPVIGLLSGTNREPRIVGAIWQGLNEMGFTEGQNAAMEFRFAEGQFDRLRGLADDLVSRQVAAIVAVQSPVAPRAAKEATSSIPIVFSIGGDPVRLGLVASLSRPGGNVTGTTFLVNSLGAKRLEVLSELVPKGGLVGLFVNPKNPQASSETGDVQTAAQALGLRIHLEKASNENEITAAFDSFVQHKVNAVMFAADAVFNARRKQIIALAARHALPTVYLYREFALDGGLISYGGHDTDAYRQAGIYVGRILKGDKPADLPVQQVSKVEMVINLTTAKAQGINIPLSLLGRADEVIE